jgi:hypothetical protein
MKRRNMPKQRIPNRFPMPNLAGTGAATGADTDMSGYADEGLEVENDHSNAAKAILANLCEKLDMAPVQTAVSGTG